VTGDGRGRRVLQVFGPLDGGVPEHVLRLSQGLAARGWAVEVAAPAESPAARELARLGMPLHPVSLSRAPGPGDVASARRLRTLDRQRGYALVHGHSSKAGALVRGALPRRERLVYTPHCFAFAASFGAAAAAQRLVYQAVEQALVPRTGTLIAVSDWERREGQRRLRGLGGRMHVVHNGVPACPDPQPDPALLAFKGEALLAGTVCGLRPQKDPLSLVRAAGVLEAAGRLDFRVAVVGNGELAAAVEAEIARLGLEEKVRTFPFAETAAPYLAALDLFVLPSLWESLPISALEALACATPVVATRVGGTPEAVVDGVSGRLVDPGDPDALATVMDELVRDPQQLAALSRGGHAAWAEHFTVDAMADAVSALYERAAGAGGARG
jgi:glycosyltransferase involved in cell wall biosynthesis